MRLAITKFASNNLEELDEGKPLVLFLHGYGADEKDLPDLMSYLPDLPWASLRAPLDTQYQEFAWYPITQPLEPTADDVIGITESIWYWVDEYIPSQTKLILIGFSQGALMATQLLRSRPERILATVLLSGFIYPGQMPADEFLLANKPKVIYCRGLNDQMINQEAVARLNTWLQSHTRATTKTYEALGHSVDSRVMTDVASFLETVLAKSN